AKIGEAANAIEAVIVAKAGRGGAPHQPGQRALLRPGHVPAIELPRAITSIAAQQRRDIEHGSGTGQHGGRFRRPPSRSVAAAGRADPGPAAPAQPGAINVPIRSAGHTRLNGARDSAVPNDGSTPAGRSKAMPWLKWARTPAKYSATAHFNGASRRWARAG